MDEGLLKARRNLMAVSVLLVLFDFADISIAQVSLLGTNLIVGKPAVAHSFAWALWGYLLLRYLQQMAAEADLGIRAAFTEKVKSLLFPAIHDLVTRHDPKRSYSNYGYEYLQRSGLLKWKIPLTYYEPAVGTVEAAGSIPMPGRLVVGALVRAAIHVVLLRPYATDHLLPLALAIAAPVVTLWT